MPDNTRSDAPKPGSSGEQQQLDKNADEQQAGLWDLFEDFQQQIRVFLPGVNGQPPTPLSHATLQRVVKTSEDMALAHEIAVNADFKLKPPSEEESDNTLHSAVRRTMHTAYWNLVQDDLSSDPPRFDMAMKILADVKKSFTVLLKGNNDRSLAKLNEVLDEASIQQQAQFGTLDIRSITNYVIELMGKACAMTRDEEVAALKRQTDTVAILRGILETLANMKIDMANYIVHVTRQQVVRSSIAYEKEKFNELKQVCGDNFPLTLEWLLRHAPAQAGAPAEHDNNEPEATGQDAAGDNVAMKKIPLPMAKAYVALLDSNIPEPIPELLKLDQDRLHQMRIEALRLSICATVLQLTVSVIPALVNQPDKRQELTDKLIVLFDDCNSKQSVLDQLEGMWAFVLKHVDEQQPLDTPLAKALKYQIGQIASGDSAVQRVLWNRLQTLMAEALIDGDNVPISGCYQNLRLQVVALTTKLMRIAKHNYAVYGDYYSYLINRQSTA
ncbi:T-complex protein 11-like protein 1 [Anopheles albimanus]|uniref:Sok1 kinase belonging to the ste20/sps1/gc kinase family n=1 Tax=Anopheles albimanus TaxID=7167 RepID=A0A182F9X9_ANOAL|nr:T-complex protein 11-like protein 1 [Anopheles albimanus]XP_035776906.1 T-complex protein 11-like protein 1 [Anopheles albimanus]